MAEKVRFELTERQAAQLISSQPPSTTRPLLRTDSNFFIITVFCNRCQENLSLCRCSVIIVATLNLRSTPLPHDRSFWIISAWSTHWRYARVCPPFMKELLTLVRIGAADGDCPAGDDSP